VFTVLAALSGWSAKYIRDRTLEGHESARARGKSIGGAAVTDDAMLAAALHLRGQEMSLRDIAARLVIATGKKKGQHPSPATVMRMLREHDEKGICSSGTKGAEQGGDGLVQVGRAGDDQRRGIGDVVEPGGLHRPEQPTRGIAGAGELPGPAGGFRRRGGGLGVALQAEPSARSRSPTVSAPAR
jgi:hypothetical protein